MEKVTGSSPVLPTIFRVLMAHKLVGNQDEKGAEAPAVKGDATVWRRKSFAEASGRPGVELAGRRRVQD